MPSVISGDANVSATEFGFLDGVTSALQTQMDSKLNLAGGKILQVVRATDSTNRSTTSTSFTDITGVSVTITPTRSDSAIILALFGSIGITWTSDTVHQYAYVRLTDSSDNPVSGAEQHYYGLVRGTSGDARDWYSNLSVVGYATPATTSAVTYKARFATNVSASTTTIIVFGSTTTTQLFALEVSA